MPNPLDNADPLKHEITNGNFSQEKTSLIFTELTVNYTKLIHAFLARKCTSNNLLPSKLELFFSHKSSSCYTSFFLPLCVALYLPRSFYQSASSLLNRDNLLHLCPSSPGNAQHTVDIQYFICQSIGKKFVILSTTLLLGTRPISCDLQCDLLLLYFTCLLLLCALAS